MMPLSSTQFELLEIDEDARRCVVEVHSFLKANARLAYTPHEVAQALGMDAGQVAHVLEKFDDIEVVTRRYINNHRYFRYLADLPDID
jgi:hypothetical protein